MANADQTSRWRQVRTATKPSVGSDLIAARRASVPANLSIAHEAEGGLHIVRGAGAYLFDDAGRAYLDAVNNVTHVGHANRHVNQRMREQQARVNTNSRYLSVDLPTYTQRLLSLFPPPLSTGRCFMVASGSEANDLAIRICRAHAHARRLRNATNQEAQAERLDMFVVLAHAYHGATNSVIDISPYKYNGKGGRGRRSHVIEVDVPEAPFTEEQQQRELDKLQATVDEAQAAGHSICGVFVESVLGCAGQVFLPPSFVQGLYSIVRHAGGLCIADEVQTGFGRLGTWWAFETLDVSPDIVTMGKSIGNGYPMAALVCTEEAAHSFHDGMEYFNSCAGTNTATAVGLAVLDVIGQQDLLRHAAHVGASLLRRLRDLSHEYPPLYEVRGNGLFIGVEIRTGMLKSLTYPRAGRHTDEAQLDRLPSHPLPVCCLVDSVSPTASSSSMCSLDCGDVCGWLSCALVHCTPMGILVGTDGPRHNVLKIKPPMVFSERDGEYLVNGLRACLIALHRLHPCLDVRSLPSKL